jgi:drug/metabolite transporter (DMT)-like permease
MLYLGSAVGLGIWLVVRSLLKRKTSEAPLGFRDLPWLAGATLSGGVGGPILLMLGLKYLSGSVATLLLNMEAVFTITLAWFVFREHFDRRIALGVLSIVLGGSALSWTGEGGSFTWTGALLVVGACFSWGIDNNLTRKISGGDPIQIAFIKGLVGGAVSLIIAICSGIKFNTLGFETVVTSGFVGLVGYGISLVFFILALRHIGTARTGAYFSTAPFIGSIVSIILLGDSVTFPLVVAALLMGVGVWFHLGEQHDHEHTHVPMEHTHSHTHDEHHRHDHRSAISDGEPHSHFHHHQALVHKHFHYPDLHHEHSH